MRRIAWVGGVVVGLVALAASAKVASFELGVARADREWSERRPGRLAGVGEVATLEILPLVEWQAARPGLATDAGVSYLVRTDRGTVLFDLGHNTAEADPAPIEANLLAIGVGLDEVDAVVVSHAHFDHVGGKRWTDGAVSGTTFGVGNRQPSLAGKRVLVPIPMTYPGVAPTVATDPARVVEGVATTGTIGRSLFGGWVDEQALGVVVAGRGLVLIVGCGHQTLPRLLARAEAVFDAPLYGVVGGLHYPVPEGRIRLGGLVDAQRRLGSGAGPWAPLDAGDVDAELDDLGARGLGLVAIGGHDSSDEVLARARARFGPAWRDLRVGESIFVAGGGEGVLP